MPFTHIVPSGWTPLRRNSTYAFRWPRNGKNPSSLIIFCSPSYFLANLCCFACVSFHILELPFPPVLHVLSRTSPPKILLSMPSSNVLPSLSIYPFLHCEFYLPLFYWDFPEKCLWNSICFFYWFGSCLSHVVFFSVNLVHQLRVWIFCPNLALYFKGVICHKLGATPVKSTKK